MLSSAKFISCQIHNHVHKHVPKISSDQDSVQVKLSERMHKKSYVTGLMNTVDSLIFTSVTSGVRFRVQALYLATYFGDSKEPCITKVSRNLRNLQYCPIQSFTNICTIFNHVLVLSQ